MELIQSFKFFSFLCATTSYKRRGVVNGAGAAVVGVDVDADATLNAVWLLDAI